MRYSLRAMFHGLVTSRVVDVINTFSITIIGLPSNTARDSKQLGETQTSTHRPGHDAAQRAAPWSGPAANNCLSVRRYKYRKKRIGLLFCTLHCGWHKCFVQFNVCDEFVCQTVIHWNNSNSRIWLGRFRNKWNKWCSRYFVMFSQWDSV